MTRRLTITVFGRSRDTKPLRRPVPGLDVDLAVDMALMWLGDLHKAQPEDCPYIGFSVMESGDGRALPKVLRTGTAEECE